MESIIDLYTTNRMISKKISYLSWVIFCCCLVVIFISIFRLFNNLELISYDLRFNLRPPQPVSADIVLIDIDDSTLNKLANWPLPRDFHASLVNVLSEWKPRAIVFDILFSEPTVDDDTFAESIKNARNVYLPLAFDMEDKQEASDFLFQNNPILADITPSLKQSAKASAQINMMVDSDGKKRRIPLFIRHEDRLVPQMALQVACDVLGLKVQDVELKNNEITINHHLVLPTTNQYAFLVNYPGKWKNTFRHFSYFDILKSTQDIKQGNSSSIDLSVLKDKVCFIGLTATGTSDLRATPLENNYPMLGLQASVFNSIVQRAFIKDIGIVPNTALNLIVFLSSLLICLRFSALRSLIGSIVFGVLYFITAVVLFNAYGLWIDLFFPLALMLMIYVGSTVYRFFHEMKERQLLEKELEIAQTIQKSFLPQDLPKISGVSLASFFQPAKFVAGDLYDFWKIDEKRLGVLIGDVAGKGVSASLVMAQAISLFRIFSRQLPDCQDVLGRLNKELCGKLGGRFVTALYLIVNTEHKKVSVASAGQGPLFLYRTKDEKLVEVELEGNVPLGLMDEVNYKEVSFNLESQDKIFIFSDGLFEARNADGEEFGLDRIKEVIFQNRTNTSRQILESIQDAVSQFSSRAPVHDDITVIVLSLEA